MPPELFGIGIAGGHHRRGLGDATIGLPQLEAMSSRQAVQSLDGRMQELGIRWKGDGAFGCTRGVDRDALEVLAAQCAGLVRNP
jgi:hypothetical protein